MNQIDPKKPKINIDFFKNPDDGYEFLYPEEEKNKTIHTQKLITTKIDGLKIKTKQHGAASFSTKTIDEFLVESFIFSEDENEAIQTHIEQIWKAFQEIK